jgi:hypothetical protein
LIKKGYLFRTADEDLQKLLELMEVNEWTSVDDGKALQNRMVYAMRNNLSDIRNAVALFSPVSVSSPKKLKHQSEKSRILVHSSNPNKLNTDINNQDAGKSVVGIMAAGLKLYATISYVTEKNLYQDKSAEELKRMLFNHELIIVKENEVTFKVTNGF